jgi:uncharacterized protein (TIGR02145 family)
MKFFSKRVCGRTLFLAALAAVAAYLAVGCGDGGKAGTGPDPSDTTGTVPSVPKDTGTFVDGRDGRTYRKVTIGTQTWMAENLNFKTDSSWCYDDADSNCAKYGRLYNWEAAAEACPAGWRLPDTADWNALKKAVGGPAGTKLKTTSGWEMYGYAMNGTDDFRFSAMPGGYRVFNGTFEAIKAYGGWWTPAEAVQMVIRYEFVSEEHERNTYGMSVRCIKET